MTTGGSDTGVMLPQGALTPSPDEVAGALMIPASPGWSRYRIGTFVLLIPVGRVSDEPNGQ
jgi:hypothetical protein